MSNISQRVRDSASRVEELGEQSESIRSIVSVIREIAEQTNLLALNAAIEAARAGENGRGFAVVADEVRKLAERTANSTKDISGKIEAIGANVNEIVVAMGLNVTEVSSGEAMAQKAGDAIHDILRSTDEIVTLVRDISNATGENAAASQGVARHVEHIAQLSEENSNAANSLAHTASELNGVAGNIRQQLDSFRV
ncbi:MAG: methyl-accepting chemotaxis protein [Rhodocyclaceae bacterium]